MDPASPDYAERLGRLLARLHSVTPEQAAAAAWRSAAPPGYVRRGGTTSPA